MLYRVAIPRVVLCFGRRFLGGGTLRCAPLSKSLRRHSRRPPPSTLNGLLTGRRRDPVVRPNPNLRGARGRTRFLGHRGGFRLLG